FEPEAQAVLPAERDEQPDVHVVDPVVLDGGGSARLRGAEATSHLLEPIPVVHGGQDRLVRATQRPVLELEVPHQCDGELLPPATGDLVVPVEDVLVHGDVGQGGRVHVVGNPVQDVGRGRDDDPTGR